MSKPSMAADVIAHMESFLGPVDGGRSETAVGERLPFKVLRFRDAPIRGAMTFTTLGVSDVALTLPDGRLVRQELVFSAYERFTAVPIVTTLHDLAVDLVCRGEALLRGSVSTGPFDLPGLTSALYSAIPVLFPDEFQAWGGSDPATIFVWLVPVTVAEREFIEAKGWGVFEDLLEAQDPDLLDLDRPALLLT